MPRPLIALACVGGLLAGCSMAMPDMQRGKRALEAGDIETARSDLEPLAQQGYEDAEMQLARAYAKSGDPAAMQQAIAMYQELLKRDPTVAVPLARMLLMDTTNQQALSQAEQMLLKADAGGDVRARVALLELYSDHPERDGKKRAPKLAEAVAKLKTPDAEAAVVKWYRRNALADKRYANELIKRCESAKDRLPECYVDLGQHYRGTGNKKSLAKLTERAQARFTASALPNAVLERLGWSLAREDLPGQPQPELAQPLLTRAAETSDVAKVRLARLLIENPHLDPEGNPAGLLQQAVERGNTEAALALGRVYLDGKLAPADPSRAAKLFKQASVDQPAAHYYLGRIWKRGYLGKSDPVQAAQHFLIAARSGYPRADQALAQLFSDNRGVRPNLPNAYVFAKIAADAKTPEGALMLSQIRAQMKPGQLQEGERLLRIELAARGPSATPPQAAVPSPNAHASAEARP